MRSCGPMDKASVYGTGDCRFESYQDQFYMSMLYSEGMLQQTHFAEMLSAVHSSEFQLGKFSKNSSKADLNRHRWIQSPEC